MAPPEQNTNETAVSLDGFERQDIAALEREAMQRGISLDEACKQLLLERAREIRNPKPKGLFGLLFGNRSVH